MENYSISAFAEAQISITGHDQLGGITQGDGLHLAGRDITLDSLSNVSACGTDLRFS